MNRFVGGRPEWGLALPTLDPLGTGIPAVRDSARAAEDLGFDSVWAGDHLFYRGPIQDCLTSLACAAGATTTLRLGTGVLLPALREPVGLVKQVTSLSAMSGGRLSLGVGVVGEIAAEWAAAGVPMNQRARRTNEFLQLCQAFLRGDAVTLPTADGILEVPPMRPLPSPEQRPDVWVGGRSPAALERTMRYGDGWLGMWSSPRRIAELRQQVAELAAAAVRPAPRLGLIIFTNVASSAEQASAEARHYVETNFRMDAGSLSRWLVTGTELEVARQLADYREAGLSLFVLHAAAADPIGQFASIRKAIAHAGEL